MRVVILSLSDPDEASHGGTIRTRAFRTILQGLGHEVVVLFPRSAPGERARQDSLSDGRSRSLMGWLSRMKRRFLPMPTRWGAVDAGLSIDLQDAKPDLVVVSALSLAPFARAAECHIWVDFMDVWSLFGLRESTARRGLPRFTARLQARVLARQELELVSAASVVTAAGSADARYLRSRNQGRVITWLPTWLSETAVLPASDRVRPVAGFIGNFDFWPNVDAYNMLVQDWLPALLSSGFRVVVAGRHTDRLNPVEGVHVIGEVGEVIDFYRMIDLSLAPIRLGGGIKVKVIESLLFGRPVLGTESAFEGMRLEGMSGVLTTGPSLSAEILEHAMKLTVDSSQLAPYTTGYARAVVEDQVSRLVMRVEERGK